MIFNQNGGSRTDTLVKLVLVFFLSLLSFSVGTFVGKQFSDSQHKQASLSTEGDRETASVDPEASKITPGSPVSDEEVANLANEFIQKEKNAGAVEPSNKKDPKDTGTGHVAAHSEESVEILGGKVIPTKHVEEAHAHAPTKSAEKKVEPGHAAAQTAAKATAPVASGHATAPTTNHTQSHAAPTVHEERVKIANQVAQGKVRAPASFGKTLVGSTVGKYTIQVSSHSSEAEAEAKAKELTNKGLKAFYIAAEIPGRGKWFRVNIGQYDSRDEALKERVQVARQSGLKDTLVQKIQK